MLFSKERGPLKQAIEDDKFILSWPTDEFVIGLDKSQPELLENFSPEVDMSVIPLLDYGISKCAVCSAELKDDNERRQW